ncbi:LysR family transcriptional regulator [Rhodobacterales bacterium HKCCE2091]|nr:LysR family transcriptional regulator [Rhodobacterales bacterium HKCCE2091]
MSGPASKTILRFDIATLVMLRTVLERRNLTLAARELGLTQPSISNGLRRVREVLGDPLLVRSKSGMVLTRRGETLLAQLKDVVPQLERIAAPGQFDPATSTELFHVAASDHASLVLVPRVLRRLRAEAPGTSLSVSLVQGGQVVDSDRPELGLRLGWLQSLPEYWMARRLIDDEMVVICARDAEWQPETFTLASLEAGSHVALMTEEARFNSRADQALAKLGVRRNVAAWTTNFSSIPLMVEDSELLALFPRSLARMYCRLAAIRILPMPVQIGEYNVTMAWHPRIHEDPSYVWLRGIIAEAAAEVGRDQDPRGTGAVA